MPSSYFRGLTRLLTEENLKLCFGELRKGAAPGVDKVTVREYGENLDERIADLVERLKTYHMCSNMAVLGGWEIPTSS